MDDLRWLGDPVVDAGVDERSFRLERAGHTVPGVLWSPARVDGPAPLVLMGHGGSGHKRGDRQRSLGQHFAASNVVAVAIDGPYHGDRVPEPVGAREYQERMAAVGIEQVTDSMVDDWTATLDVLDALDLVDGERVGYLGLSMGTRFGLPFVARANRRLRCAVFGKYGLVQPASMPAAIDMAHRFRGDAPAITLPVLFHVQWDDELFPRAGQFDLFELLGSRDKQLVAFPGPHGTTAPVAVTAWCDFIARRLGG